MGFNFPDAPTPGQVFGNYTWDVATGAWKLTASGGSGGGGSITISDTPPASPAAGALWWESDTGNEYIYYNDGNSSQWVMISGGAGVGWRHSGDCRSAGRSGSGAVGGSTSMHARIVHPAAAGGASCRRVIGRVINTHDAAGNSRQTPELILRQGHAAIAPIQLIS